MKITVIVCTYNRCQLLKEALNSVAAQCVPDAIAWEVLVVDNNSNDRTAAVVEEFCRRWPGRFRYAFEPKPGKSHALNSGIQKARGEILAFLDDDARAEPTWLQNLTATLQTGDGAGSGGRILPDWPYPPPRWVSVRGRSAAGPLVMFDLGEEACDLGQAPFGTNMAFRRDVFEKYGSFRTDLGPCPGSEIRGEDSEFASRLLALGQRLRYEPAAVVYHPVAQSRLKKKYFLAWWLDKGRSDIRSFGIDRDSKYSCRGIPLYLFRKLAVLTLRWILTVETHRRFECKLQVWAMFGQISECHRQGLLQNGSAVGSRLKSSGRSTNVRG